MDQVLERVDIRAAGLRKWLKLASRGQALTVCMRMRPGFEIEVTNEVPDEGKEGWYATLDLPADLSDSQVTQALQTLKSRLVTSLTAEYRRVLGSAYSHGQIARGQVSTADEFYELINDLYNRPFYQNTNVPGIFRRAYKLAFVLGFCTAGVYPRIQDWYDMAYTSRAGDELRAMGTVV